MQACNSSLQNTAVLLGPYLIRDMVMITQNVTTNEAIHRKVKFKKTKQNKNKKQNFNTGLALISLSGTGPRCLIRLNEFFWRGGEDKFNCSICVWPSHLPFGIFYCFKAQEQ